MKILKKVINIIVAIVIFLPRKIYATSIQEQINKIEILYGPPPEEETMFEKVVETLHDVSQKNGNSCNIINRSYNIFS